MKKIKTSTNLIDEVNKIRKYTLVEKFISLPLLASFFIILVLGAILVVLGMLSINLVNPFTLLSSISIITRNVASSLKKVSISKISNLYKRFSKYSHNIANDSIDIVPGSLKIGEDLSSKNIVPIFVEGNYVIIKKTFPPVFFFQPNENTNSESVEEDLTSKLYQELYPDLAEDLVEMFYLEATEEDVQMLEETLPAYEDEVKYLRLAIPLERDSHEKH